MYINAFNIYLSLWRIIVVCYRINWILKLFDFIVLKVWPRYMYKYPYQVVIVLASWTRLYCVNFYSTDMSIDFIWLI